MKNNLKNSLIIFLILSILMSITSCNFDFLYTKEKTDENVVMTEKEPVDTSPILKKEVYVDFTAPYATYSIINSGHATLYYHNETVNPEYTTFYFHDEEVSDKSTKRKVVAVNAGHGTKNGSKIMTFAHPDLSPKVAGGTNKEGSILSSAISDGTVLNDGRAESKVNLLIAMSLKEKLLAAGYDVLMMREDDDTKLDNIARTVIANENADIHIAIHIDSTDYDKGIFYITPYNDENYLNMEPLKSNKENIKKLGRSLIDAFKEAGEKVWKESGTLQGDLTQLSYSTNASVDIELGDRATVFSEEKIDRLTEGLKKGIDKFFEGN